LEKEVADLRAIAEERGNTVQDLQQQLDDAHVTTDSSAKSSNENENWSVVRDELQRQAGYLRSLESINAKLTTELARYKDRHTSVEVLREEKRTLESKVAIMEGLREKVAKLEAQVEAARQERKDWQVPTQSPHSQVNLRILGQVKPTNPIHHHKLPSPWCKICQHYVWRMHD
jgi:mitotic spindle assembly checkpoint protein MAD1